MFSDLSSIKTIDVTGIDFSRVGNFKQMFCNCENLEEIKGVIDMRGIGNSAFGWTDNFNDWKQDPAPPNIDEMFYNCPKLKKVTILARFFDKSNFNLNENCDLDLRHTLDPIAGLQEFNAKIEVKSS